MNSIAPDEVTAAIDALFAYLRDTLYNPNEAKLEPESLPEPFQDLASGLVYLAHCMVENRALSNELANGNLTSTLGSRDNELVSGLKNLQATLKHITWQVGQVAKGDYKQHLSFSGEFSEAINDMITQLAERDEALRNEIAINQQMADDFRNNMLLLKSLTENMAEWVIVVDRATHEWLFSNHEALSILPSEDFIEELTANIAIRLKEASEDEEHGSQPHDSLIKLMGADGSLSQFFTLTIYPLVWTGRKSMALVLSDVTADHQARAELEQVAYFDTLTGTYSRHYGMITLERWQQAQEEFVLAFVDMDGLKYVNDTFGHGAGDEYILATSRLLATLDTHVIVSRLGGDEFMVLCKDLTEAEAKTLLEALRRTLAKDFEGEYERSFSYGLVEVTRNNTKSASLLLSTADEAMYEDKRSRKRERRSQA